MKNLAWYLHGSCILSWKCFTVFYMTSTLKILKAFSLSITSFCRAFDTLAKALNTTDGTAAHNLADGMDPTGGGNIHVISRDQSTPIIEVEGPLLTDTHVTFKVYVSRNVLLNKLT